MPVTDTALDLFSLCLALAPAALPDMIWRQWSLAPAIVLPLVLMAILYYGGIRRAGPHRTAGDSIAFAAGMALLAVALVSPLCRLAATLVSAHMAQLMILAIVAPFLLALGRTWEMIGLGIRQEDEQGIAGRPTAALPLLPVGVAYGVTIWAVHAPPLYTATLTDATVHILGVVALVGTGTAFWTSLLAASRNAPGRALAMLFATMGHTGLLGAILTFANTILYPVQTEGALIWGLDPLADQQLAGMIMWVVGNALYLSAGLCLAAGLMARLGPSPRAGDR